MINEPASHDDALVRMVILAACCAAFMNILDISIVNVSLPSIVRDLHVDISVGACFQMAYAVMLAGTVLAFGKLADRFGMRCVMAWGFLLFTGSSLFCGLAPTASVLVVGRLLQGIGAGMLSATSLGVVGRYLCPKRRGWGIGMVSSASALGAMLGAPIGGFLSGTLGWRWIFFVNLPGALAAWLIVTFRFPKDAGNSTGRAPGGVGIDWAAVLLIVVFLTSLLYGIIEGPEHGWFSPPVLGSVLCAAAFCIAFLLRERRSPDPLLSLELFRDPRFLRANIANFCTSMFVSGVSFLLPFYFIFGKGLSESATGMILVFFSVVYVLVSPMAGRMSDRIGARSLTTGGMTLASASLLLFTVPAAGSSIVVPVVLLAILGAAYGAYLSPNNRQILSLAPPDAQGSASGVLRLFFYIGQPLGIALAEAVFRGSVSDKGLPVSHWNNLPPAEMAAAFQNGFMVCAVMTMLSAVFSFFSSTGKKKGQAEQSLQLETANVTSFNKDTGLVP
jgi:EmrB/QacA subfamily drug resistance transporter